MTFAEPGACVDLTNCDREPIHLLGFVQPFGFLIAVQRADWVVARVSRNVGDWLGIDAAELLGRPLDAFFTSEAIHTLRGHLQSAVMGDTTARAFALEIAPGLIGDVAVHLSEDAVVIECEPTLDEPSFNAAAIVRGMTSRLRETQDERAFYRVAAREMRALTGFDRVMIYRFDEDGSGAVIAESARSGLESYLGLHYPASDIPKQARILYERNWLRIIPDIEAAPSPVEPALDANGRPLDLSMSVLRSVSSIHIEYLRNMGVRASMSVSILKKGKLWGLFACHHYAPHPIGFGVRTAAELFGQIFSLKMENREREAELDYETRAQKSHQRLITVMANEGRQFDSIVDHLDDIADLLACDGVALWIAGRPTLRGRTPNEEQVAELVAWLREKGIVEVHARHEIGADYPPGRDFAGHAAGMLVVPLSRPARDYIVFFREEAARSVNWAGEPAKPVTVGPLGERLTPRRSFALWKETVTGQSIPWRPVECRIAETLRVSLLEVILRLTDATEEERRKAQERQELLIAELNHRVRNILSLIRGVISQSKDPSYGIEEFTEVVGGRIQALARAHDQITAERWGPGSFQALIAAETGAYLGGKAERIVFDGPDALVTPEAFTTMALVVHEMITNSAKYGGLSDSRGRVEIATEFDRLGRYVVNWREVGGPLVRPPSRRGFGSTVIERSLTHDLKGDAQLDFRPEGLAARFVVPATFVSPATVDPGRTAKPALDSALASSAPMRDVLLVEDNMIISLDVQEMLQGLGVGSVRTASGVAEALALIEARAPEFAFLDVNLGGEPSFAIADRLAGSAVPFAFVSGYGDAAAFPERFASVRRITKPYVASALIDAMSGALAGG